MDKDFLSRDLLATPIRKLIFLTGLFLVVYFLPYAVPVKPVVSVSYVAHFSNRAALFLFVTGALVFSALAAGRLGAAEPGDSRLSARWLLLGEALVFAVWAARTWAADLGPEAEYVLHREQMILAGRQLYIQMDYLYGPVLIMPGIWLAHLFRMPLVTGYMASLVLCWIAGVWMIWYVIRNLSISFACRTGLFAGIIALEATALIDQGTHYTPVRRFAAALAACLVFQVFMRTRNAWRTVAAGIAGTIACLLASPEQAIGFTLGMLAWLCLCRIRNRSGFTWATAGLFILAGIGAFAIAAHYGMFREMLAFAAGGNSFPLLPSAETLLILLIYVAGIAAGWRALLAQEEASGNTVLLCLVSMAMLPAAFGRCDLGHLWSAMPLTLIGAASLLSMPKLRPWLVSAVLFLLFLPKTGGDLLLSVARMAKRHHEQGRRIHPVTLSSISFSSLPCDQSYYSPELLLDPRATYHLDCVDLGYKRGLLDIYTAGQIAEQITEMTSRPGKPLLISNRPFSEIFEPHETSTDGLTYGLEGTHVLYIPPERIPPLSFQPIGDYILAHYTPGPALLNDQVRIWYPKSAAGSISKMPDHHQPDGESPAKNSRIPQNKWSEP